MRYFVIHPSGQRFGPADAPTLSQWAAEGRLAPTSLVAEESSGRQLQAGQVPGIIFPGGSTYGQPGYGQPGYGQGMASPTIPYSVTGNSSPYAQPPSSGYGNQGNPYATPSPYNPYTSAPAEGSEQLNLAYILSGVSLGLNLICCVGPLQFVAILCAVGGLISAIFAKSKGARAGGAIAMSVVALLIPFGFMVIGHMLMSSLSR